MWKKRVLLFSGVALAALILAGGVGVAVSVAQEPTPPTCPVVPLGGRGFGGLFGHPGGGSWTLFDAAAEALGLSPEELFSELHAGKTLAEVAEARGVEMEAVQEAIEAARADAMREAIQQAVEDGKISQEQADWMLEGLEKGYLPMGRGFGHRGFGGWGRPSQED